MKKYIRKFKRVSAFLIVILLILNFNLENCFASGGGVIVASLPTTDHENVKHLVQSSPMPRIMTANQVISLIDNGDSERAFVVLTQAYDCKESFLFESPYLLKEYAHMLLDVVESNPTEEKDRKIRQAVDLLISSAELEVHEEGELEARNFLISYVPNTPIFLESKNYSKLTSDFIKAWNSTKKKIS